MDAPWKKAVSRLNSDALVTQLPSNSQEIDFKRHKDAVAYFNKTYIAKEIFPREMGKRLGRLKQERENSDYDDFYVASLKDASDQYKSAKLIIEKIEEYLVEKGIQY